MNKIIFLNHASYLIETKQSILIADPWIEGKSFNNGWSLIDKSTSIKDLVNFLEKKNKNIYIWYSHEHSDHFDVKFLRTICQKKLNIKVVFQKTLDGRVAKFIRSLKIKVIETSNKLEKIDEEISIVTFPYFGGDSYNLTIVNNFAILNLNDCVVSNDNDAMQIRKICLKYSPSINLIMTQFGYANWIGNKEDFNRRQKVAKKKYLRIKNINNILNPEHILLFASYVYFSHPENFYMNDMQNTPEKLYNAQELDYIKHKFIVLKPWDEIKLPLYKNSNYKTLSLENTYHWKRKFDSCVPDEIKDPLHSEEEIFERYKEYRKKIYKNFLFLPKIFEKFGILPCINIYVNDIKKTYSFSYLNNEIKITNENQKVDIELNSATLIFLLKNDFGMNTTYVNGKFKVLSRNGENLFYRHFSPQEYMKNGWGLKSPFLSAKMLIFKLLNKIYKKNLIIN